MTTTPTNLRLDEEAKKAAYAVFQKVGIKPAQAFNLFLRQVALRQGLPFDVHIPNAKTIAAIKETEKASGKQPYANFAALRKDLGM